MMRTTLGTLIAALGLLGACGQKGPLVLPDHGSHVVTRPPESSPEPATSAPVGDTTSTEPVAPASGTEPDKKKKQDDAQH
jgi:predicted small lipoprotein YifL